MLATMSEASPPVRLPFDFAAYEQRVQNGPCFVCATVSGYPDYEHDLVYEDRDTIAFLSRHPTLLGYSLVAPRRHVERLETDLTLDEHLNLQKVVYRVAKAVAGCVPTERVYVLSLGSQQGNAHLHWHVAPLPPGVPYEQQQFHALMAENGVLDVPEVEQREIAASIRRRL
jgi:histidine triad (HIT) family protein/ATP adenylyltransferase